MVAAAARRLADGFHDGINVAADWEWVRLGVENPLIRRHDVRVVLEEEPEVLQGFTNPEARHSPFEPRARNK